MKLLHGQERARVKALLGSAKSFREKCAQFFEDAAADLAALNKLRVSTNVIAASIVHYAWDWCAPKHHLAQVLLAQGPQWWGQRWAVLRKAARILDVELAPIVLQADLLGLAAEPLSAEVHATARSVRGQRRKLRRSVRQLQ